MNLEVDNSLAFMRSSSPLCRPMLVGAAVVATCLSAPAAAQTLDKDYWVAVQAYYPRIDTNVSVTANTSQTVGSDIDFERDLDMDKNEILPAVSAGARFGRIVVGFDFFKLKRQGSVQLARDIEFDDVTYPASAQLGSSFDSDIYRLTVGYSFVSRSNLELGAAIGLHATRFDVALEGEATVGGSSVQARRREKNVLAPIPTIGAYGTYRIADRWTLNGRVDYLSLKIGDYDGRLINAQAGVNFKVLENIDLGAAYRYVDYRVGIEKDAWEGRVRYKLHGPALLLQASF